MGERRRRTLGGRGAQPDPIRNIGYGVDSSAPDLDSWTPDREWRRTVRKPRCRCGIELPVTGKCDYCDD